VNDPDQSFQVTHPFHPLRGRRFALVVPQAIQSVGASTRHRTSPATPTRKGAMNQSLGTDYRDYLDYLEDNIGDDAEWSMEELRALLKPK